ncbi:E3 ubiquitin-protein ligase TRIM21-like [Anabas testudineus]|uniref:E3 ubiquitin-protein ligase TRIM21-like n=1 Tax=Anabas testudineus TaxID=64144 RepID=UPI000E4562E2|nr:E3 ubiquitin-protein ligase TRIM21-like [Anabas testudineus]
MAAASCLLTEDQFLCSICLDVFTDPVSIPCGHNFCKTCITEYWNINVQCQCPVCKRRYNMRPELQINTFISEMAAQFRQSAQQKTSRSSSEQQDVEPEIHQMIQKRRLKIEEIKASVQLSNKDADREIAEGVQVFTALKESVERGQAELIKTIKEKQRTTEKQAEDFIKELEQEISDLNKRSSEVEQLSQSEDHLHLLQVHSSLNTAPPTKDWTEVSIRPSSYEGAVVRAVAQLEEKLTEQMKNLFEAELRRVRMYVVNVTLDPGVVQNKPTESKQQVNADKCRCVLSNQGFSSGRFYFETRVDTWSTWTLGVARKLTNICSQVTLNPRNGFWTVCLKWKLFGTNRYSAGADPSVCLSLKSKPKKVGVFVDYEQGLVSFHDADTAALIYSFTGCSFTDTLYPFFSPCDNDGGKIHGKDEGCVVQ